MLGTGISEYSYFGNIKLRWIPKKEIINKKISLKVKKCDCNLMVNSELN